MIEYNKIYFEDCLEGMKKLDSQSIDFILADLPYGTTQNKWDSVIPLELLWKEYKRIIKNNGTIALHAVELFSAKLLLSNELWYRYKWFWQKDRGTGHLNAKKCPMKNIEEILIFSPSTLGNFTYNPQMIEGEPCHTRGKVVGKRQEEFSRNNNYGSFKAVETKGNLKYPKTLLYFQRDNLKLHDTQKPVALEEYLIKTYTNENGVVLDNCIGSGTTAIACINTNRNYVGFENDSEYYKICMERISKKHLTN